MAADRRLKKLRLRFIVLLDQKIGREKAVLRRSIAALDRKIREQAEKPDAPGYITDRQHDRHKHDKTLKER